MLQLFRVWHLPMASGGGLRLVPPRLLRRTLRRFERDIGGGVFYLHPWELDPESPTCPGPGRWWLRVGRQRLEERLAGLLRERTFLPIQEAFPQLSGSPLVQGDPKAQLAGRMPVSVGS